MSFTPSSKSSFIAGVGFWVLLWLAVLKLDEIAACLRLRRWLSTDRCLAWVDQHKALALLSTARSSKRLDSHRKSFQNICKGARYE